MQRLDIFFDTVYAYFQLGNGWTDKSMKELSGIFGKNAQIAVLEALLNCEGKPTYISGLAEETGLSNSTVSRALSSLVEVGLVEEHQLGRQVKIFRLRSENRKANLVVDFYRALLEMQK